MERKPGKRLRPFWPKLTGSQEELRRTQQPPLIDQTESPVGSCFDYRLDFGDRFGPFCNEEKFHDWTLLTHDWQGQHDRELSC